MFSGRAGFADGSRPYNRGILMGDLYRKVSRHRTLEKAWRKVRSRGLRSESVDIRAEVQQFDEQSSRNLRSIQQRLIKGSFQFAPQTGVAKKRKGKTPRPIVISPVENRIVQRAILDILSDVAAVKAVLNTPTSVGGIEGVDKAIALAVEAIRGGAKWFIRSDIPGFFTKIPKSKITDFIRSTPEVDEDFARLFDAAMAVNLANAETLGEDALLFPNGEEGVAQGSSLSPLIGNILLRDFDQAMNGRGITCIRYIDDFLILGSNKKAVERAFSSAKQMLADYGMDAYDPGKRPDKAAIGEVGNGFEFLGCHVQPGLIMPSKAAREKLLEKMRLIIGDGKRAMKEARNRPDGREPRYAQTLCHLDRTIKGWGDAFAFCNARQVFQDMDEQIDNELSQFKRHVHSLMCGKSPLKKRRILGVHALQDTAYKALSTRE